MIFTYADFIEQHTDRTLHMLFRAPTDSILFVNKLIIYSYIDTEWGKKSAVCSLRMSLPVTTSTVPQSKFRYITLKNDLPVTPSIRYLTQ